MKMKKKLYVLIVVALLALIPTQRGRADMAPKPIMDFEFVYETDSPLQITDGELLVCEDAACSQAISPEELDPYGYFRCDSESCKSISYDFPGQQYYLIITFSDGEVRESNLFSKDGYEVYYRVTVREDTLLVEEVGRIKRDSIFIVFILGIYITVGGLLVGLFTIAIVVVVTWREKDTWRRVENAGFIIILVLGVVFLFLGGVISFTIPLTAGIELFLGWLYTRFKDRKKSTVLTTVLMANVATSLGLWSFFAYGMFRYSLGNVLIGEGIIWLVEAVILFVPMRKTIKFGEALLVSLVLNAVSFGVGLLLPF
jgi:hypothetical protein